MPYEIIFTRGATDSINLVAASFGRTFLQEGDEIIVSEMEHHANIVPWQFLGEDRGCVLKVLPFNEKGKLCIEQLDSLISPKTKILAVSHVSNSLGTINPVKEIIEIAHKRGVPVLLDGAQAVSHCKVDVQALDCEFYCFSGHKMYAPMGIGVMYGKEEWLNKMKPYQGGGEMIKQVTFPKTKYMVFHPKFIDWAAVHGISKQQLEEMDKDAIMALVEKSPYYKSMAADTDYIKKVELQGMVQKWVDHSISVTVNLPSDVSEETVANLYIKAWEVGCKGMTVYREGSRDGVLNTITEKKEEKPAEDHKNYKRPTSLPAEVVRFKNNCEDWIAFVGLRDGRPYEIFTGKTESDRFVIPKWVESGFIIKNRHEDGTKTYDFQYYDKDGYEVLMSGLSRTFNPEFWNYAKMISALLRHEIPMESVINIISGLNFREESINSWKNGVIRALKKFLRDGTKAKGAVCPKCGQENTMEYKEGCLCCSNCGYSKCGS